MSGYTPIDRLKHLIEFAEEESCGDEGETLIGIESLVYYGMSDEVLEWLRWALVTLKEVR